VAEQMVHLTFTQMQANHLAIAVKLANEVLNQPEGTVIHALPADWKVGEESVRMYMGAIYASLIRQMEGQMPK
jgi:hypothetical protein